MSNDPNRSTRGATPNANVPLKSATFICPWGVLRELRCALAIHLPRPTVSAVGRNQSPESPSLVVAATDVFSPWGDAGG